MVSDGAGVREEGASSGLRGGKQAGSGEVWVSLSREEVDPTPVMASSRWQESVCGTSTV